MTQGTQAATRRILIDGKLIDTTTTFPSVNPANGEVIGHAPDATAADAHAAIAAARRAFDTTNWATDVELRTSCLNQLHQALSEHKEELRELTIADCGAPRVFTYGTQLDEPIEIVRYYADLLQGYCLTEELGEAEIRGQKHRRWVAKEAAGVVAAVIPYNYPNQIGLAKLAPALAAGCTVVLKGAPQTPLITLALGELVANHTDVPAGVVSVLTESGSAAGQLLATHPDVDMISFTGSTATGRAVMRAASDTIKRVFLELGGKSAMILLDDADLDTAVMFPSFAICSHARQRSALPPRLLVPRDQHDAVVERVAAALSRMPVG